MRTPSCRPSPPARPTAGAAVEADVPAEFPGGLTGRPGEQVSRSIERAGKPTDGPAERAEAPGRLAAVLGKPIGHSLSPVLHRAAYVALGLAGWRYSAIECAEDELARV